MEIHLEGPWNNTIKRGAHIESLIHPPAITEAEELLNYGKGVIRMITLAPEVCSNEVIDLILSHNIVISAGHSNATYEEAKRSFANGINVIQYDLEAGLSSFESDSFDYVILSQTLQAMRNTEGIIQ